MQNGHYWIWCKHTNRMTIGHLENGHWLFVGTDESDPEGKKP